jgi:hypothetical protein
MMVKSVAEQKYQIAEEEPRGMRDRLTRMSMKMELMTVGRSNRTVALVGEEDRSHKN